MKKKLKSKIEKTIKKLSGGLYSEVIYKYETIEDQHHWEHTNFVIRFIFSSHKFLDELIEFIMTSNHLNKAMTKYKDEYHIVIGGEIKHFIQLIKNASNTNNTFFKQIIGLLYYLDKSNFEEFINNNIMHESKFVETPNSSISKQFELLQIDGIHLDDIEYIYNKLNGLLSYRELLNLTIISYPDSFYEHKRRIYNMSELRNHCSSNSYIKEILEEHLEPIIGNLDQYKIDNYFVELKDERNYIKVDEPIGEVVEEEFKIEEDEEGNLKYNEKNYL